MRGRKGHDWATYGIPIAYGIRIITPSRPRWALRTDYSPAFFMVFHDVTLPKTQVNIARVPLCPTAAPHPPRFRFRVLATLGGRSRAVIQKDWTACRTRRARPAPVAGKPAWREHCIVYCI